MAQREKLFFESTTENLDFAELCKLELYGEYSQEEFAAQMNQFSPFEKCSVAWPEKTIAFRCFTCSYHPNVAICNECFDFSKHENHNYIHYESFGGVCDCGDEEALKAEGFCDKHGLKDALNPPSALVEKANEVIRVSIVKCAHMLSLSKKNLDCGFVFLLLLKDLAETGYFMQKLVADSLLDPALFEEYYSRIGDTKIDIEDEEKETVYFMMSIDQTINVPVDLKTENTLTRTCFLEWLFVTFMTFSSDEIFCDFILTLLPIKDFKIALTKIFAQTYPYMIRKFLDEPERLQKTLKKISIQLLSSSDSVTYILESHTFMENLILVTAPVIDQLKTFTTVWPPIQDFLQLISHKTGLEYFLENEFCFEAWLEHVRKIQGRFTFERELKIHVEYDSLLSFEYFKTETEICTLPVWTMLPNSDNLLQPFLDESIKVLNRWANDNPKIDKNEMTFNLPLHRIVALLLSHQLHHGYLSEDEPRIKESELKLMIEFPIRTIAAVSEVLCNFWLRNGKIMEEQAILYKRPLFSSTTYDPDLFLIQFLCSRLSPDYVVEIFLEKFSVLQNLEEKNWFKRLSTQNMLEEALFFLASLISCRVLSSEDEEGLILEELIALLSIKERTHEEVLEFLPNRGPLINAQWETAADHILSQIADFRAPEINNLSEPTEGQYSIEDEILFAFYDPVLVRMRSLSIKDYGGSIANYLKRVERKSLKTKEALWPPFRIPQRPIHPLLKKYTNFLHSLLMQAFIFVLLHKCLQSEQAEGVLQITIHLLHMTLVFPYKPTNLSIITTLGNIYETCLVPMDREYGVLAPYGLNNLFKDLGPMKPSETSIFPLEKVDNSTKKSAPPPSSNLSDQRTISDLTILSMLLQLYKRYSKKVYRPSNDCVKKNENMRVGGGEYYIEEVLEKLVSGSEEVRRVVEELTEEDDSDAKKAALDRKKMLVKNKMKKMMTKKREKSMKAFAEAGLDVDIDLEEDEEGPVCCICNSSLTPSATDPPCFVALLTKTNIMGLRRSTRGSNNTYSDYSRTLQSYIKTLFPDMKPDLEWHWSGMIQTCGHMLHKDCYLSHVENLAHQRETDLAKHFLEYWCPLCRQLCNTILPLPADEALEMSEETTFDYEIFQKTIHSPTKQQEICTTLKEIAVYYKDHLESEFSNKEMIKLFRNNVEIELMTKRFITEQNNNSNPEVSYQAKKTKKTHLGALRAVCSNYLRATDVDLSIHMKVFEYSSEERSTDFTIALYDLRQCLVISMLYHYNPSTGSIRAVVRFFVNLFVINMLTWLVFCTKEEDLVEWTKNENLTTCQFGEIVEMIVTHARNFDHKRKSCYVGKMSQKVNRIFSDFLRFCVLVYNSVVNPSEATIENIDTMEMGDLLSILLGDQYDNALYSIRCLKWKPSMLSFYIKRYSYSVGYLLNKNKEFKIMKRLAIDHWETPNFIILPSSFRDFLMETQEHGGSESLDKTDKVACLMCGKVDTYTNMTLKETVKIGEIELAQKIKKLDEKALLHTQVCANGTCIFVGNADNRTMIVWGLKFIVWKSLYVNCYGEDDPKFKHGRELMLDENRMHFLRSLWVLNQLDKLIMNDINIDLT